MLSSIRDSRSIANSLGAETMAQILSPQMIEMVLKSIVLNII